MPTWCSRAGDLPSSTKPPAWHVRRSPLIFQRTCLLAAQVAAVEPFVGNSTSSPRLGRALRLFERSPFVRQKLFAAQSPPAASLGNNMRVPRTRHRSRLPPRWDPQVIPRMMARKAAVENCMGKLAGTWSRGISTRYRHWIASIVNRTPGYSSASSLLQPQATAPFCVHRSPSSFENVAGAGSDGLMTLTSIHVADLLHRTRHSADRPD